MVKKLKWIFFDCFSTLLDDFDLSGDESGMKPVAHIPVKYGLYEKPDEFHQEYLQWRQEYWAPGNYDEVHLPERLGQVLEHARRRKKSLMQLEPIVEEILSHFHQVYPDSVRRCEGIEAVLNRLAGQVKMGVVSNFFLPGYPKMLLQKFELDHFFDFILDSAEINVKKPGPEIYTAAMKMAAIDPAEVSQILFVGDNLNNDVLKPAEMGMLAMHFKRSHHLNRKSVAYDGITFQHWDQFYDLISL